MRRLLRHRNRLALIGGAVVPLLVAAILVPFRGTFASTAAALVMVCVILAAAVSGTRLAGVVASVSAERPTTFPVTVTTLSSLSASAAEKSGLSTSITHCVTP